MTPALLPPKNSLMWRILKHYLILIVTLFLVLFYCQSFFYNTTEKNAAYLSQMLDIQQCTRDISAMYDNAQNYYYNQAEEYRLAYRDAYSNINNVIDYMASEYNDESFIYRDLRAILDTYYEDGTKIMNAIASSPDKKLYVRGDFLALSRLRDYLDQELYFAIENLLNESKDYAFSAISTLQNTRIMLNVSIIFFIMVCVIFAYTTSRHIANPIHQLSIKFQELANGNLDIHVKRIAKEDEINMLIDSFNSMVEKLKESQEAVLQKANMELQLQKEYLHNIEMENLLKESELRFLQMQINPHFLFNTLNSIYSLAQIEEAEDTCQMISSLSTLLRYALSTVNEMVPLSSEEEIARNYLYIQKTRFGPRLNYEINIAEDCKNRRVPSMLLQPLIENALIHGLEPCPSPGRVSVIAKENNGYLEIVISDNGIGMSPKKLKQLQNLQDETPEDSHRGIGIRNVQKRLLMLYGKNPMEITSQEGKGTIIRILL